MRESGGRVLYQFKGFPALLVALPDPALSVVRGLPSVRSLELSTTGEWAGDFKNYSYWRRSNAGHGFVDIAETGGLLKRGILDTGVQCGHPDFTCPLGASFSEFGPHTEDDCDHGTGVYAVVAARRSGNTSFPYGYAPAAVTRMYRIDGRDQSGECVPVAGYAAAAVDSASYGDHVHAISMSFVFRSRPSSLENALGNARAQGIFLIAAAGNSGREEALYPAAFDFVMAVSGLECSQSLTAWTGGRRCDGILHRWISTTYGTHVDVAAVARRVLVDAVGNATAWVDGTSYAAPTVAAGGILVMQRWPNSRNKVDAIMNHLKHTAFRNAAYDQLRMGAGILDAAAAIALDPCSWQACLPGKR